MATVVGLRHWAEELGRVMKKMKVFLEWSSICNKNSPMGSQRPHYAKPRSLDAQPKSRYKSGVGLFLK
jgi:hypothetical protein